ncbi:hypothetical protein XENOCAPTIV_024052 [Xenoophorus captivus]|uniref:Uncharacterized protein n=1 Tax=Xenoophorus captivus TaxID=1517983 RepID=A0ABV0S2I7_9TELE
MGHASSACPPEALLHYVSLDWQAEVTYAPMGGTSSQYKSRRHVGDLQSNTSSRSQKHLSHGHYRCVSVTGELRARLSLKSRRRRLARQASLSEVDPMMGVANPPPSELPGTDEREPTLAGASWGDQLDPVAPLTDPEEDEAALPVFSTLTNAESESEVESISLRSDDDELDCEPCAIPSAAKPSVTDDTSRCGSPNPTATDLHDVCRRAAKKLGIEWPKPSPKLPHLGMRGSGFREPNRPADSCCQSFPSASRKQPGPGAILSSPRTPPWEGRRWTGRAWRPAVFHICLP